MQSVFEGVVNNLERRYLETSSRFIREWLEQYMVDNICPTCNGKIHLNLLHLVRDLLFQMWHQAGTWVVM